MRKLLVSLFAVAAGAALPFAVIAFRDAGEPKRIPVEELRELLDAGQVLLIDVRREHAYRDSHISGAESIPLGGLENHLRRLGETEKTIVTYCRCPGDSTSLTAARRLDKYGIGGVRVLDGGYDAWVAAGGVVESSAPVEAVEPEGETPEPQ